ncbi:MAG: hypothetical protein QUS33_07905 [Dehalococcoidia bacterium]|jgi:hypothetical protein|nr:hypothetical protein [Dehalococcoidia bacterium]
MSETTEIVTNDFNISEGFICTLDRTSTEGKVAIAKALNGSEPLKDHMNEVLHLAGVITTPGVRAQSGANCTNNYLVLDDGTVLFSQSDGVTRSLKVIAALWGGDLHDGKTVDVKCISQNLTNGNTLKTIIPA